jgi:GntR family transcriptional regulator/MocR family aminotransferase
MNTLKELIQVDKSSEMPLYLQIANSIMNSIRRGHLRRGLKLPGSREIATILGIHRKTILAAYDELVAQGWIEMISRKGTFVVQELPEIKPKKIISNDSLSHYPAKALFYFNESAVVKSPTLLHHPSPIVTINDGFPDIRLAPTELFVRELRSMMRRRAFKKYYSYGSPQGPSYLLETLAAFLTDTRGLPISTKNLMVTKGAQLGLYLAARLLIKQGDHVIVGEPSYFGATLTFQQAGAVIQRVRVDDKGIDVDLVETLCKNKKIRLVYVIPHHHHPTTVTLSPERRIRLLELAVKYKFAIIEDDYDYDFHYTSNPVMPMASLDHYGNVIYVGTLTKTLAPAIRIGFIVAPENFIEAASELRRWIDRQGDTLLEVALAELYKNGTMTRHIKKAVKLYRERRDFFCDLLKEKLGHKLSFKVPDGGMSVWTKFHVDLKRVSDLAATKGLAMSDGKIYNGPTVSYNSARLGFASLNFKEQEKAIEILTKCM